MLPSPVWGLLLNLLDVDACRACTPVCGAVLVLSQEGGGPRRGAESLFSHCRASGRRCCASAVWPRVAESLIPWEGAGVGGGRPQPCLQKGPPAGSQWMQDTQEPEACSWGPPAAGGDQRWVTRFTLTERRGRWWWYQCWDSSRHKQQGVQNSLTHCRNRFLLLRCRLPYKKAGI